MITADTAEQPLVPSRAGTSDRTSPERDLLTAPVQLNLVTPAAAVSALQVLGIEWAPTARDRKVEAAERISEPGLYAWVPAGTGRPMSRGALYWGVGRGKGGVDGRLDKEFGWVSDRFDHGHGLAMYRLDARPVRGRVTATTEASRPQAADWPASVSDRCRNQITRFLNLVFAPVANTGLPDLLLVEQFVIRFSIQAGQTGAPVQSQHASAWATFTPADWAAYAVRRHLQALAGD